MAIAEYNGEEISATFSATMEKVDYGVDRSPVWEEATNIQIVSLSILGVEMPPLKLPEELRDAILVIPYDYDLEWQ